MTFLGILIFSECLSDDTYMIMRARHKNVEEIKYTIKKLNSSESASDSTTQADSVTNGTGLNLMLIDDLTESYAKELLTCMRNSYNGVYDDSALRLTVESMCGLQAIETGFYSGTKLLKSYLPFENGNVVWNTQYNGVAAENMTLSKYDSTIASKACYSGIDHGSTVSVFQYDSWSTRAVKSKVNGAGNSSRSEGDHYFYPDVLATNNNYMTKFIRTSLGLTAAEQSDFSTVWMAFAYAVAHNRGESGFLRYTFGFRFDEEANIDVSSDNIQQSELLEATNSLMSLYTDYREDYPNNYDVANVISGADTYNYVVLMLATHDDDWYLSQKSCSYAKSNISRCLTFWKALFPNEDITEEELKSKIDASTANYDDAIKEKTGYNISISECQSVYSTINPDDYNRWTESNPGYVFKVTTTRSAAYNNKYSDGTDPYIVQCMDVLCAREALGACFGDIVYANMLYYAGLGDVDPTNPETYYSKITESADDSFVPSSSNSSTAWMEAYGVDVSSLSVNQINELQTAYNLVNLPNCTYEQDGPTMDKEMNSDSTPTVLDCSGFVSRVLDDTGFTGRYHIRQTCTGLMYSDDFECIDPSDLQPGDILVNGNHTMIYLSGYTGGSTLANVTIMESNRAGEEYNSSCWNYTYNRWGPNIRTLGSQSSCVLATDGEPKMDGYNTYILRIKTRDTDTTTIGTYD
jgi:hypothetical protein